MTLHNYSAFQEHKAAHKEFIEIVENFQTRFGQGRLLPLIEVADSLKDWISNHILDEYQS